MIARAELGEFQPGRLSLVHTCRKNRGWLLLVDVIEIILYLCKSNLKAQLLSDVSCCHLLSDVILSA